MTDVVCVVRGYRDTEVELLIGNVQQWNSEGYNLNLVNFIVIKLHLNKYGNGTYANI